MRRGAAAPMQVPVYAMEDRGRWTWSLSEQFSESHSWEIPNYLENLWGKLCGIQTFVSFTNSN